MGKCHNSHDEISTSMLYYKCKIRNKQNELYYTQKFKK